MTMPDRQLQLDERAPSPDEVVIISASASENFGPSENDDAEFARELAKMVTDASSESRKVDKKTALALWDQAVVPPTLRKKRVDGSKEEDETIETTDTKDHMKFTFITKRGNKPQVSILLEGVSVY